MSFWNESSHRAAKRHQCDECCGWIEPGERYTLGAGINVYGEFGTWKSHPSCLVASREGMADGDCSGDEYWPLHEQVADMMGPELCSFALRHPEAAARFSFDADELDHFVWRGPDPHYIARGYRWEHFA